MLIDFTEYELETIANAMEDYIQYDDELLEEDELIGGFDIIKGERIKIKGYLEDFALSRTEADNLIMTARDKIYKN